MMPWCPPGRTWRSGWALPGLGFFVCENLIEASMPPSMHFGAVRQARPLRRWCASNRRRASLRARPADGSTGRSRALPSPWPAARVLSHSGTSGRSLGDRLGRLVVVVAEQALLPAAAIGQRPTAPACRARSMRGEPLRAPCRRSESNAPALISDSIGRAVDRARIDPLAEIEQAADRARRLARSATIAAGRRAAAALDGRQAEADLAVGDGELGVASGSRPAAAPRCPSAGSLRCARPASLSS